MDEKNTMENLLQTAKGACELYMHGAQEASTPPVRTAFTDALNETLALQNAIYQDMAARGWYQTQQADAARRRQLRQKYCC